jgi:hypothetical protein
MKLDMEKAPLVVKKFARKPLAVEAALFDGKNAKEILRWVGSRRGCLKNGGKTLAIDTDVGDVAPREGDWIARDPDGGLMVHGPVGFGEVFEPLPEEGP